MHRRLCFLFFALAANVAKAELKRNFEILGATTYHQVTDSQVNSGNRLFEIPTSFSNLEFRPDVTWDVTDSSKLVVRSKLVGEFSYISYQDTNTYRTTSRGSADLSDAFLAWNISGHLLSAIGLQNYQWGPAELYSPSNPFFHFNSQQKSFFYKEKGHALVRLNASFDSGFDLILVSEPISNNEKYWIEDRNFGAKNLLKVEYQFADRINSVALLGGTVEDGSSFVGEYANFSIVDGLSIYGDARHTQGAFSYRPIVNAFGLIDLLESDSNDKSWSTLGILGVRWEQGSFDVREELLSNDVGYSQSQWDAVVLSVTTLSPNLPSNLRRLARPGLEFLRQHYSYTSLRIPDLGKKKDLNLYLRYLLGLDDSSGVGQVDADKAWTDSTVIYFEMMVYNGPQNSEFRLTDDYKASFGIKIAL